MPPEPAQTDRLLPILAVNTADIPDRVLVVGDPGRAEATAELLDDAVEVGHNREYLTFRGTYKGTTVAVISHGVGAAGAAICFEELCQAGAKRIIRAGTAGGMQEHVRDGSIVIVSAAVRADGVTQQIVPPGYPAAANIDVVLALRNAAAEQSATTAEGIILTYGLFYPHKVIGSVLEMWQRAGVVAVEMECAALFVIAAQYDIAAGAVLAIDGNPLADDDDDMTGYDPHRTVVHEAVDMTVRTALDALVAG